MAIKLKAWAVICESAEIPICSSAFKKGNEIISPFAIFKTREEAERALLIAPKTNAYKFSAEPKIIECVIKSLRK